MKQNITSPKRMLKFAGVLFILLAGFNAQAQHGTPDIAKQPAPTTLGSVGNGSSTPGGYIRVVDNKGTIKFLQVQNGITQVTSTTPAGGIITTWQLGGQLTDSTYIDVNGKAFTFQNMDSIARGTGIAATQFAATGDGSVTGYSFLVHDEATGRVKKMLATDLIQSGQTIFTATAAQSAYDMTASTGGQPLPVFSKVWVYRNGVKLEGNVDYTIAGTIVTIVPNATPDQDFTILAGDKIEVQYLK
ncbi:hypothetical protein [Taibaiella soli]|uniref:Lipocalin-like domain-containing protein n=1 Tax=Taibaiella soli TaxID=1649169 RepID=A0A2W2BUI9_9BACT|nr:hypothetical protein [Taibaiella soli]PZF71493.1 hypothetical protein DN068_18170 [Taibaiella soli]